MPAKKHIVSLTNKEREQLRTLVNKGSHSARRIKRGQILLLANRNREDGGWKDVDIAAALMIGVATVERIRKKYAEKGMEASVTHAKPKPREKVLDGRAEARLVQLACSESPEGSARWTLELLKNRMVELKIVETVSKETIRTTLKKTNLSLG